MALLRGLLRNRSQLDHHLAMSVEGEVTGPSPGHWSEF